MSTSLTGILHSYKGSKTLLVVSKENSKLMIALDQEEHNVWHQSLVLCVSVNENLFGKCIKLKILQDLWNGCPSY